MKEKKKSKPLTMLINKPLSLTTITFILDIFSLYLSLILALS